MQKTKVGIIGAGVRGCYCLGEALVKCCKETDLIICGLYDILPKRSREARRHLTHKYRDIGVAADITTHLSMEEAVDAADCVLLTNHTNQHREPALYALRKGKKVYLDKPISVTPDDAAAILAAEKENANPLIMGFTRRYEAAWIKAFDLLRSGVIGTLAMMEIHSVIPYTRYLQTWHRQRARSGGSLNDKCSHHFDVFNWMTGEDPEFLTAVGGRSVLFPEDPQAPKRCRECRRECPYRRDPHKVSDGAFVLQYDSWKTADNETDAIDGCVYASGSDICDHALISVVYPSGIKASLFFAIFGPDTSDQEMLILIGEKGKITVNRHEGWVRLASRWGKQEETFDCRGEHFSESHFGADIALIEDLQEFCAGKPPRVSAADGALSLEMVLRAQESMAEGGHPLPIKRRDLF